MTRLRAFDPAEYLNTTDAMAAYLEDAIADNDTQEFREAVKVIVRVMTTHDFEIRCRALKQCGIESEAAVSECTLASSSPHLPFIARVMGVFRKRERPCRDTYELEDNGL